MQQRHGRKSRAAFTLIEIAIVLGIAGLVLGAVWGAAGKGREAQKQNDAYVELQTISQNFLSVMGGQTLTGAPANITSSMIASGVIPANYVVPGNTTVAGNPWNAGGLVIYSVSAKVGRIAFYSVSQPGCIALLTRAVSCQIGEPGCPVVAYVGTGATYCKSDYCNGVSTAANPGWQNLTVPVAKAMCDSNSYVGGANSLQFDYSLN